MEREIWMKSISRVARVFIVLFATALPLAAQVSGAIFTTTVSGTTVNGNIYDFKEDVYLNGGPQNANCEAAGLPDGDYYFQVTDPSGSVLLSSDAITERAFRVSGGVIVQYLGTTHSTSAGPCSSVTVQLMPYDDTPNAGGEYKVWATPVADYHPEDLSTNFGFANNRSKTDNFKVRHSASDLTITGMKFYDTNTNGQHDSGEPGIAGWRIELTSPEPLSDHQLTYTSTSGVYSFIVNMTDPGPFTISEVIANPSWIATTVTSSLVPYDDPNGPHFGNVCVGAGGGLTLGFWSNKNGQKFFSSDDLALMVALNLRNADGTNFNPASYAAFRTWLLNATATNMAYMLSAQLAAMELNVLNGFVSGGALIYAPGTGVTNTAGFATVGAVMTAANTELGLHPRAMSGDSWRSYQEALKNALDNANNNRTFVQPGPCAFTTPY